MTAPVIAQSGAAIWNSGTPTVGTTDVTCNITGVTAGNFLAIKLMERGGGTIANFSVTVSGSGNTVTARGGGWNDPAGVAFFDCRVVTGGSLTVTLTKGGNNCAATIEVKELSGVSVSYPLDAAVVTAPGDTTNATGSITTASGDTWIEAAYASYHPITMGSPQTGWTQGYDVEDSTNVCHLSSEYRAGPATAGAVAYGWPAITNDFSRNWLIGAIAYAAAAPAPVISSPGRDNITSNGVRGTFTSDVDTGTSYLAVSESVTPPSEAQILAGSGGGIVGYGTGSLVSGANAITIASGLTSSTAYYCHMMASNGLSSNIITSSQFTTLAQSPVITGVSSATPADGSSLTITSAGGATGFGATQSGGSAVLGGTTLTVTSWSDTSIEVTNAIGTNLFNTPLGLVVTNGLTGLSSASFAGVTGIVPPTGYDVVTLASLNSESDAVLLEALPELATSNQIEWETVDGLVTVNNDATVTWDPSVTEFDVRAGVSTDGWGDWKTVQLSSGGANTLTSSLSAAIQAAISATASASAAVQTGKTATVGADTYVGVAATPEISASVSAAVQSSQVATTSLAAAVQSAIAATAAIDIAVQAGRASTVSASACVVTSVPEGVSCVRMTASMTRPVRLTTEITQCRLG